MRFLNKLLGALFGMFLYPAKSAIVNTLLLAVIGVAAVILIPLAIIGAPIYFAYQAIKDTFKRSGFFGKAIGAFLTWFLVQVVLAIGAAILLPIAVPILLTIFVGLSVWDLAKTFVLGATEGFEKGLFFDVIVNFVTDFVRFNSLLSWFSVDDDDNDDKKVLKVSDLVSSTPQHLSSSSNSRQTHNMNRAPNSRISEPQVTDVTRLEEHQYDGICGGSMSPLHTSIHYPNTLTDSEISRASQLGLYGDLNLYQTLHANLKRLDQDLQNRSDPNVPLANVKCAISNGPILTPALFETVYRGPEGAVIVDSKIIEKSSFNSSQARNGNYEYMMRNYAGMDSSLLFTCVRDAIRQKILMVQAQPNAVGNSVSSQFESSNNEVFTSSLWQDEVVQPTTTDPFEFPSFQG